MGWQLSGQIVEACSCKMMCRCTLGPAEPDQGWCSAAQAILIERGNSDGVDLSGAKVALALQLPGDFFGGIELARLYFDEGVTPEQRREMEAIFTGERGGVWEGLKGAIASWLPAKTARIAIDPGDDPSFSIAGFGGTSLTRLKTSVGKQAVLQNAPVAEAFALDEIELAQAERGRWKDPDMREWENWGFGAVEKFNWRA